MMARLATCVAAVFASKQLPPHVVDWSPNRPSTGNGTSLMGLKLASTGSTWWHQALMSVEGVHIKQELYTSHRGASPEKRARHMLARLVCPERVVRGVRRRDRFSRGGARVETTRHRSRRRG